MPIFKYYDEAGKLITERNETLTEENFARFVEMHGEEYAAAYMQALYDVYRDMDNVVMERFPNDVSYYASPSYMRRSLNEYLFQKEQLFLCERANPFIERISENGIERLQLLLKRKPG